VFIPSDKKRQKSKKGRPLTNDRLIKQGVCLTCGGEVIDYGFIEAVHIET